MWTKDNVEDLLFALEASSAKHLDRDAVTKAYYELELSRAENAVEKSLRKPLLTWKTLVKI